MLLWITSHQTFLLTNTLLRLISTGVIQTFKETTEPFLVNKGCSLVDQNVGTSRFHANILLIHHLLHGRVSLVRIESLLPVFVFATETLTGYLALVKVIHQFVVEFVPESLIFARICITFLIQLLGFLIHLTEWNLSWEVFLKIWFRFPILYERVVMSRLASSIVHNNSLESIGEIFVGHSFPQHSPLILIKIFFCQISFLHLFQDVLFADMLLRVGTHVKFFGEGTVVVDLVLTESVIVEFEAF